jgi:type IV pilus assembly protein PilQ
MSTHKVTQRYAQISGAGLFTTIGRRILVIALTFGSISAMAANRVEDISYASTPDGATEVTIKLAEPPAAPRAFATEAPPRIAVDLEDTRNALTERRINIGSGAASSVSAVEAGGRTRVVVELFHPAPFETRVDGNNLVLLIGRGTASATASSSTPSANVTQPVVSQVDFRRGSNGEGRILISFDKDGAGTDLRKEGNKLIVDLYDVTLSNDLPIRLDVTDFATPVQFIETRERAGGARMEIQTGGAVEHMAYQTGNELVVEVAKANIKDDERKKLGEPVEYKGTPVTFNIQDIPVRSALQLIADVSELNIVVADSVSGNVTLRLVNVPWDQALDIILQAKGLDKRTQGNVVWIAPTAEIAQREQAIEDARIALEDRAELITEYIPVNYGSAEDIARLLTEEALEGESQNQGGETQRSLTRGFLSKRGSVTFDKRTNTLLVNDTAEKIKELKSLIALLDRPVDQVLIESRIVVATDTFSRELGARFGVSGAYEDHHGNIITSSGSASATDQLINNALANRMSGRPSGLPVATPGPRGSGVTAPSLANRLNVNLPATAGAGSFGWSVLAADYILDLELSALQTEGRGEVVASPRVITANQREAVIRQGDEIGYVTISAAGGSGGVPIPQVQFKEILLELKVIPTITQDDRIFLSMNVKKDELAGFVSTSIGDVPQINKRELNTAVLVENGQTVVLGGVYEFKTREDLSKVPFLGDLPALGNLFKKKSRETSKAELLIFVTPKILRQRGKK